MMSRNRKRGARWLPWMAIGLVGVIALCGLVISLRREEPSPQEAAKRNQYSAEAFYREDGFLRYADAEHMVGIDVSTHQGLIDWQQVADSGVEFAIIRIGYRGSTVGELYGDEQFRYNLQSAQAAGLKVGAYFFSQARNADEAEEEAEFACELLDGAELELPLYYDWETVEGESRVQHPSEVDMTACALAFCKTVEAEGYLPGVYFNQTYGYDYLDLGALTQYHLWLAEYNKTPTFSYHFDCLQYSDSGAVAGIEGSVDMDLLILTEETENAVEDTEN